VTVRRAQLPNRGGPGCFVGHAVVAQVVAPGGSVRRHEFP
jgi:hypothetical protein